MDQAALTILPADLNPLLGTALAPVLVDLRRRNKFPPTTG
jgi:hypothetical protein